MLNHTARVSPIRAIVAIALALICFSAVAAPVLNYQGRLLAPGTNQPKPDGDYSVTFGFYGFSSGGSALWSETKTVTVSNGLFSTLLGDTTPLDLKDFDGRAKPTEVV